MHVSIMDRSPSTTASTLPSHRFSTYPSSPSDSAFSAQYARKLTPCTRPRKTTTARTFTGKRNEAARKNFIVATGDSCRGRSIPESGFRGFQEPVAALFLYASPLSLSPRGGFFMKRNKGQDLRVSDFMSSDLLAPGPDPPPRDVLAKV